MLVANGNHVKKTKRPVSFWTVIFCLLLGLITVAAGALLGNAQASGLNQTKGTTQNQTQEQKGSSPDDIHYPLYEGFESGALASSAFLSHVDGCVAGGCRWQTTNTYAHTGAYSAVGTGSSNVSDQQLVQNSSTYLPSASTFDSAILTFWHKYSFETTGSNHYDGAVLELSTNNGGTWSDAGSLITSGGYNGTIFSGSGNPLAGRSGWVGSQLDFTQVQVDISSFPDHYILFRFREGTDNSNISFGWIVDDIQLTVHSAYDCFPNTWAVKPSYPLNANDAIGTSVNGAIYMFGGYNGANGTEAYMYTTAYDWEPIAPLPSARNSGAAVSDGTYVYISGGLNASSQATNTLYRYNPASNSYTTLAPSTYAVSDHALAYLGNKIYRIGGNVSGSSTNTVEVYDIATNTWSASAPYPIPITSPYAVGYTSKIYVGGGSNNYTQDNTYAYDPATNTWDDAAIADLPSGRVDGVSGILNGRWIIAGGKNAAVPNYKTAVAWNPATNTWSSLPDLNENAEYSVGGTVDNAFYVVAGSNSGYNTSYNQAYSEEPCTPFTPTPQPPTSTPTPGGPTPTACAVQFTDVPANSTFYQYIRCLACRGIISGYGDGTFRPANDVTRGQIAKIVSNAAGYSEQHSTQTFEDIPLNHTFYIYVERLVSRNIIGGYACGGAGEPCVAPANRPYFRSNSNASRGQLAKIVIRAFGPGTPSGQAFEDVPTNSTFYSEIEQLYEIGSINGYACGGPGEPCIAPTNRPYFRPGANVSRGQTAKIISSTFFPGCVTP